MKDVDFEKWLEERFVNLREVNGTPITKDNCEDLFNDWLTLLTTRDLIRWGDIHAREMYLRGKAEVLGIFNRTN
jgi:hypothetical protein